jgi:2-haloacid dehalogenase
MVPVIRVILWDVDGTLLDFLAAERHALRQCFARFGLGDCTQGQIDRYSAINRTYWRRLEQGELTKQQVLVDRFAEFFAAEGTDPALAAPFNEEYQLRLGDTVCFLDGSDQLVRDLRGQVKQYAATNGTYVAQKRKLALSGFDQLLDGVFISDQIGAEKPSRAFFDHVFAHIGPYAREEILMVGDSLTSDMQGGCDAGIQCCWYNPNQQPIPPGLNIRDSISHLEQVRDILARP